MALASTRGVIPRAMCLYPWQSCIYSCRLRSISLFPWAEGCPKLWIVGSIFVEFGVKTSHPRETLDFATPSTAEPSTARSNRESRSPFNGTENVQVGHKTMCLASKLAGAHVETRDSFSAIFL
jgi:hypothetical protein